MLFHMQWKFSDLNPLLKKMVLLSLHCVCTLQGETAHREGSSRYQCVVIETLACNARWHLMHPLTSLKLRLRKG